MSEKSTTDKMTRVIEIRIEIQELQEEMDKLNQEVTQEVIDKSKAKKEKKLKE